ncbi:MAG: adenylosuccinate lyase [Planctomycetes bacterium]|nr:adenylosuccinate lyase [Planctomycetota bacterium]
MSGTETLAHPLADRYASREMVELFSPRRRARTWRELWVALADCERELGLPITAAQVESLRAAVDDIDLEAAARHERDLRHDVMAHVRTYADRCPEAGPIIHLGATSCYVTDNADLIVMREGLGRLAVRAADVVSALRDLAVRHRATPTVGLTHFQSAQFTTVGKRACLWAQDFVLDVEELERVAAWLPFLGVKGTTGTQASFLRLFDGELGRVLALDRAVARRFRFERLLPVSGQTYTRKVDSVVAAALSGVAQSASKFAHDLRLLQGLGEASEPMGTSQVGSSAMAYKANPMRSERISGLARWLIVESLNPALTAATQWFERTLDDSVNRRLFIPGAFLAADALLDLSLDVARGLEVHERAVGERVRAELPFIATEDILMEAVKAGGDRQALHERIRVHALEAARRRREGEAADLLGALAADPAFSAVRDRVGRLAEPARYVGCAPEQVDRFLAEVVDPLLLRYLGRLGAASQVRV